MGLINESFQERITNPHRNSFITTNSTSKCIQIIFIKSISVIISQLIVKINDTIQIRDIRALYKTFILCTNIIKDSLIFINDIGLHSLIFKINTNIFNVTINCIEIIRLNGIISKIINSEKILFNSREIQKEIISRSRLNCIRKNNNITQIKINVISSFIPYNIRFDFRNIIHRKLKNLIVLNRRLRANLIFNSTSTSIRSS